MFEKDLLRARYAWKFNNKTLNFLRKKLSNFLKFNYKKFELFGSFIIECLRYWDVLQLNLKKFDTKNLFEVNWVFYNWIFMHIKHIINLFQTLSVLELNIRRWQRGFGIKISPIWILKTSKLTSFSDYIKKSKIPKTTLFFNTLQFTYPKLSYLEIPKLFNTQTFIHSKHETLNLNISLTLNSLTL